MALPNKLCKLERCSATSRSRHLDYAEIFCKIQYLYDTIYGHLSWQYWIFATHISYWNPDYVGDISFSWEKSRTFTYLIERYFIKGRWNWGAQGGYLTPIPVFCPDRSIFFFIKSPNPPFFDLPSPLLECRIR